MFIFTNREGFSASSEVLLWGADKDGLAKRHGSLKDKVPEKFSLQGDRVSQDLLYGSGLPRYPIRSIPR